MSENTPEETLRELHSSFTSLEGTVETAINELRTLSGWLNGDGGEQEAQRIANELEAELEQQSHYLTLEDYRRLLPPRKPLPPEHELDEAECHNCGHPWNEEEWKERHVSGGPSPGESWYYSCPNCGFEVFEVGT